MRTKAQRPCQAPFRIACGGLQGRNGFIVLAATLGLQVKTCRLPADETVNCGSEEKSGTRGKLQQGARSRLPTENCRPPRTVFFSSKPFQWDLHKMHKSFWRFATGSRVGPGSRTTRVQPSSSLSLCGGVWTSAGLTMATLSSASQRPDGEGRESDERVPEVTG